MPLYEYECDACGRRFEVIQKMSDPVVETCPTCGGRVHKLQSAPAFQFKGTGWYVTDYAKKEQPAAKTDSDSKTTKAGDKGEKGTDTTKSAPTTESSSTSTNSADSSTPKTT
jgi:putative FmdB family regulatory protein